MSGGRSSRPHILSQEEILKLVVSCQMINDYSSNILSLRRSIWKIPSSEMLWRFFPAFTNQVLDVSPPSRKALGSGTRVCAYWSQKFSCLYPGTVSSRRRHKTSGGDDLVSVDFDDGDSGRIPLGYIRMLPPDFPVKGSFFFLLPQVPAFPLLNVLLLNMKWMLL